MGNKKSRTATNFTDTANEKQTVTELKGTEAGRQTKIRIVQNVLLIWLDRDIDENSTVYQNTIDQLRPIVNKIETYTNDIECTEFLERMRNEKICMVISGSLGKHVVPRVHKLSQLHSIFIFCGDTRRHEKWTKKWSKIRGIFTMVIPICKALMEVVQQCEQDAMSFSFMDTSEDISTKNLHQSKPSFVYTQILKEILLTNAIEHTSSTEFIDYWRDVLGDNEKQLKMVDKFEHKYHEETPIWWYTSGCFLNSMINRAFHLMDVNVIIKMGFFIRDLHHHIEQLHHEQFSNHYSSKPFTVYRGQSISETDFEQISRTRGGLMSFNSFLSTSTDLDASLRFAQSALTNSTTVRVLFVMTIDPNRSTSPFAAITSFTYFKDKEDKVLFSMNTVFRIVNIVSMDTNYRLFEVVLTLVEDKDNDLRVLRDRMRQEIYPDPEPWHRLNRLLLKMGKLDESQQPYELLLKQTTNEAEEGRIHYHFARTKDMQGNYKEAIKIYEKALEIYKQTHSPADLNLPRCYNDMGLTYRKMGDYFRALSCHEKALRIFKELLPSNHPELAICYNDIGLVNCCLSNYSNALLFYDKAVKIQERSLLPDHSHLGMSYNNMASVYQCLGDYPKALVYYKKGLEISRKSLPSNPLDLAASLNNIGSLYSEMCEYLEALSHFKEALKIQQQVLSSDHPHLAVSFSNIATLYGEVCEYTNALPYFKKALSIQKQLLPSNHPNLATSYHNIGNVHSDTGDYPKALSFYEKALEIQVQSLVSNHPDLVSSYNNIGSVYDSMGEHQQALTSYEKALAIQLQSLPANHPDFGCCYNNIGAAYENMGEYATAHSWYERAVNIGQPLLSSNRRHLRMYRKNLENIEKKL